LIYRLERELDCSAARLIGTIRDDSKIPYFGTDSFYNDSSDGVRVSASGANARKP